MTKISQNLALFLVSLQLAWGLPSDSISSLHSTQTLRQVSPLEGPQEAGLEEALGGKSKPRTKPPQLKPQLEPLEERVLLKAPAIPPVLDPEPPALIGEPAAGTAADVQRIVSAVIDTVVGERAVRLEILGIPTGNPEDPYYHASRDGSVYEVTASTPQNARTTVAYTVDVEANTLTETVSSQAEPPRSTAYSFGTDPQGYRDGLDRMRAAADRFYGALQTGPDSHELDPNQPTNPQKLQQLQSIIEAVLTEYHAPQGAGEAAERFDLTVLLGNYTRVRVNTLDPGRIAITYSRTPPAGPRGDFIQTHTVKLTNERIQVHTSDQAVYGGPVRVTDKLFRPEAPRYDKALEQAISTMQTTIGAEPNPGRNAQLQAVVDRLALLRQGVTFIGIPVYESNPLPVGVPLAVTVTLRNPTEEPVRMNLHIFLGPRFSAGAGHRLPEQKVLLRPGTTQSVILQVSAEQLANAGITPGGYDLIVIASNPRGNKELARISGPVLTVTPAPVPVIEGGFENFLFVPPPGAALISGYRVEIGTEQLVSGPNGPGTRIRVPITLISASTGEAVAAGSRLYTRQTADGSRGSLILESQTHGVEDRFITYSYSDPQNLGRITGYSVTERKQILDISDGPPFLRTVVLQGTGEYLYRDRELSLIAETLEGTDARTGKRYRFVRSYELAVTDIQIPSGAISIGIEWVGSSVGIPQRYAVSSENGGTVFYTEQNMNVAQHTGRVDRYALEVPYPVDAFQSAFVYRDGSVRFLVRQPDGTSRYVAVDLETGREDIRPFALLGAQRYTTIDGRYVVLLDTPLGPVDDFLTVFDRQTGRLGGIAAYSDDNIFGAGTYEASQLEYHPKSGALSGFLDGQSFSVVAQREPETPSVDPYLQTQIDSTDAAKDVLVVTSSDPSLSGPRVQRYDYAKGRIQSAEIVAGSVVVDLTDGVEILPERISLMGDRVVSVKEYLAQQQLAGHPHGYFEVTTQVGQTLHRYILHRTQVLQIETRETHQTFRVVQRVYESSSGDNSLDVAVSRTADGSVVVEHIFTQASQVYKLARYQVDPSAGTASFSDTVVTGIGGTFFRQERPGSYFDVARLADIKAREFLDLKGIQQDVQKRQEVQTAVDILNQALEGIASVSKDGVVVAIAGNEVVVGNSPKTDGSQAFFFGTDALFVNLESGILDSTLATQPQYTRGDFPGPWLGFLENWMLVRAEGLQASLPEESADQQIADEVVGKLNQIRGLEYDVVATVPLSSTYATDIEAAKYGDGSVKIVTGPGIDPVDSNNTVRYTLSPSTDTISFHSFGGDGNYGNTFRKAIDPTHYDEYLQKIFSAAKLAEANPKNPADLPQFQNIVAIIQQELPPGSGNLPALREGYPLGNYTSGNVDSLTPGQISIESHSRPFSGPSGDRDEIYTVHEADGQIGRFTRTETGYGTGQFVESRESFRPGDAEYAQRFDIVVSWFDTAVDASVGLPRQLDIQTIANHVRQLRDRFAGAQQQPAAQAIDAMLAAREAGRVEPLLAVRQRVDAVLGELAEAAEGNHVVVFDAETLSNRIDLQEFAARVPDGLRERVILLGDGLAAREAAARNGITLVDELAEILVVRPEAETIGFVGSSARAEALARMLRGTAVAVHPIDPGAGLDKILREMGISSDLLRQVDTDTLRRALERLFSA